VAVVSLGVSPSEFWAMTPEEFWWLHNFKYPDNKQKSEDIVRLKKLLDSPEARPSKGIKHGSNT
jgi:hypothetical protein